MEAGSAEDDQDFNPRTPCGVRHPVATSLYITGNISIHAPLAGCDWGPIRCTYDYDISIHAPLAGCDQYVLESEGKTWISIHAPLAGCDGSRAANQIPGLDFNPRTPCGVRHDIGVATTIVTQFQSTHPLRGATASCEAWNAVKGEHFNPRTPCGVRPCPIPPRITVPYFNPRTPCGVRPAARLIERLTAEFQSTHPLRGAT